MIGAVWESLDNLKYNLKVYTNNSKTHTIYVYVASEFHSIISVIYFFSPFSVEKSYSALFSV